ncbi:hypothetical protein AVEN_271713-1 [Araneus ventricosus]|uniref:Uncharacterized protein n=1 Tax=Araneus ventricosus TaxID=182803 RepID=A0A4Y2SHC2_ARAVE|nr:hypothetical protein AVEN_271713-1 [Araneus ventricosus]
MSPSHLGTPYVYCGVRTLVSNEESGFQDKSFIEASLNIMQFSNQWFSVLLSEKHNTKKSITQSSRHTTSSLLSRNPSLSLSLLCPSAPKVHRHPLVQCPQVMPSSGLERDVAKRSAR